MFSSIKKQKILITLFILGGALVSPFYVFASKSCQVGDGEGEYSSIKKAIGDDCDRIDISKGTFKESVVLGEGVELKGSGKGKTFIKGTVTMNNKTEIADLTIDSGGVVVNENSDAIIEDAKVSNPIGIGIDTSGGGSLKVKDSEISSSRKGFYLQKGTKIEIVNCEVINNDEEGVDIRAKVRGKILGNNISNNGESGIELILGGSDIYISGNKINKNDASGIAFQYYTDDNKLGSVEVEGNEIEKNEDYGISCKAPSGGKGKPKGYWSDSVQLISNSISGNGEKSFASSCKFDDGEKDDATKDEEEIISDLESLEEKVDSEELAEEERKRLERLKKEKEEREALIRKEEESKASIDGLYGEFEVTSEESNVLIDKIESRFSVWSFIIGPDYKSIGKLSEHLSYYDNKISEIENESSFVNDIDFLSGVDSKIDLIKNKKETISINIAKQENRFSLLGWIFRNQS